jgi:hypothetical protein
VGDFITPVDQTNLVKGFDIRRKSTMNAKNFSFNDCSCAKKIKDFSAEFPGIGVSVFSNALIIVPIDL